MGPREYKERLPKNKNKMNGWAFTPARAGWPFGFGWIRSGSGMVWKILAADNLANRLRIFRDAFPAPSPRVPRGQKDWYGRGVLMRS